MKSQQQRSIDTLRAALLACVKWMEVPQSNCAGIIDDARPALNSTAPAATLQHNPQGATCAAFICNVCLTPSTVRPYKGYEGLCPACSLNRYEEKLARNGWAEKLERGQA